MVFGFWDAQLSAPIRTKLAGMSFTKDTYHEMFKVADSAFAANGGSTTPQPAVVAAVTTSAQPSATEETPQVAAASRGSTRGRGRGGQRGRGRGRGSSSSNTPASSAPAGNGAKPHQKGPKHSDLPSSASWACAQHWKKGRSAPYCSDPTVCQWNQVYVPRT